MTIRIRTRFFLAVEGESERSFIKWLQQIADDQELHVHLDCQPLGGGGYQKMLNNTLRYRKRNERSKAKATIMLIDGDRSSYDDDWSLDRLKQEASRRKIDVCVQYPNQEGLLLRMMSDKEIMQLTSSNAQQQLRKLWPTYQKPVDAYMLASRFSLDDLLRIAKRDADFKNLLTKIGLYPK